MTSELQVPPGASSLSRMLERIALGVVGLGCVALVWYHRVMIDTAFFPAIIDEYWIAVSARWINEGLLPYRDFFHFHFPGSYYLYAVAERCLGGGMTALRAVNSAVAVLFGVTLAVWFRMHGRSLAASIGVALLVSGPCFFLWPIITPHPPGMLALAVACVLLFRRADVWPRAAWLLAGALLFLAGWTVQTLTVLAVATLAGALLAGVDGATRRQWVPWVVAGAAIPLAVWIGALLATGQWEPFLRQAVSFVVSDGYKQTGGVNDVSFFARVADRVSHEVGWGKLVFAGAASACVAVLWGAPIAGFWQWRSTRRALLLPAAIAPLVFLSGRTDAHHAFYLCVPGFLILATPRWEGNGGRLVRRLGLSVVTAIAFAFFLATMPHLRGALQAGLTFGDDRAPAREALAALAQLGVEPGEPVAVMPWAANLYFSGVVPGHRFTYVSPASEGFQSEREWQMLREQMHASRTRWLAFYPASSAGNFLVDGRPAGYLSVDGTVPVRVGRSGPIELWRLEPAVATEPNVRWPIPTGWKHETFPLPPEFAPTLPYRGTEDLRFMPGFSSPTAPDFWSYDFVWWLDQRPAFDAASVGTTLTTYFQGLATAVGGSKYRFDPAHFRAVLSPVPGSEPPRLTGQVFTYDPFATGLPITLNVEAELRSCPGTQQVAIVVALSPKDGTDSVWKSLRGTAGTLVCQ